MTLWAVRCSASVLWIVAGYTKEELQLAPDGFVTCATCKAFWTFWTEQTLQYGSETYVGVHDRTANIIGICFLIINSRSKMCNLAATLNPGPLLERVAIADRSEWLRRMRIDTVFIYVWFIEIHCVETFSYFEWFYHYFAWFYVVLPFLFILFQ